MALAVNFLLVVVIVSRLMTNENLFYQGLSLHSSS